MTRPAQAMLALAMLVSLGLWLSMYAAAHVDVGLLPAHSLRRVRWWQANARHVYLACAVVAVAAAGAGIGTTVGWPPA